MTEARWPCILVDADACPVVREAVEAGRLHRLPVTLLCDEHHLLASDYARVQHVSSGADAVDLALMNLCRRGDIVVTQDYGLAAMVLGKGAFAIHHTGKQYTNENIELMLMERHMARKARRASGKHHLRGPARFTNEDRMRFRAALEQLISAALNTGGDTP